MISVIIPAYNEETRLGPTLDKIIAYFQVSKVFNGIEIIVSDDGSTDQTPRIAHSRSGVVYLSSDKNRGKGHAVRKGVLQAKGDVILISDADLSTPIEELSKLYRWITPDGGYDVAIGSRSLPESEILVRQKFYRQGMGVAFNKIMRATCGLRYIDTQCGFKLFTRSAAMDVFTRQTINGYAFDVEVLMILEKRGYNIKEVPIRWTNSPSSRVSLIKDATAMLLELMKIRFQR